MALYKQQKKQAQKQIKDKISTGLSKQAVYDELVEEYKDRNAIANMLDDVASLKSKQKYGQLNTILLVTLSIIAFVDLAGLSITPILIDCLLIYYVATYKIKYYTWIAVRGLFSVIMAAIIIFIRHGDEYKDAKILVFVITTFVLIILSFVLGLYLSQKLSIDYKEIKESYLNDKGEKRLRIRHEFVD